VIEAAQRYPNVRVRFNHRCTDVDLDEATARLINTETNETTAGRGEAVIGSMARSPPCVNRCKKG